MQESNIDEIENDGIPQEMRKEIIAKAKAEEEIEIEDLTIREKSEKEFNDTYKDKTKVEGTRDDVYIEEEEI